jgi:hypothetical protein
MEVSSFGKENALVVLRRNGSAQTAAVFHFADVQATLPLSLPGGPWEKVLDSSDARWGGPGGASPEMPGTATGIALAMHPKSFILLSNREKGTR